MVALVVVEGKKSQSCQRMIEDRRKPQGIQRNDAVYRYMTEKDTV